MVFFILSYIIGVFAKKSQLCHFLPSFTIVFQFHASASICPNTAEAVREVVTQNKTFKKEHVLVRLQQSMMSKVETDMSNVSFYQLPQ